MTKGGRKPQASSRSPQTEALPCPLDDVPDVAAGDALPDPDASLRRLLGVAVRLSGFPAGALAGLPGEWSGGVTLGVERLSGSVGPEELLAFALDLVAGGEVLVVPDAARHADWAAHSLVKEHGVRAFVTLPVRLPGGALLGALCLFGTVAGGVPDAGLLADLSALADLAADQQRLQAGQVALERQRNAGDLLSQSLREALSGAQTLQAISALSDLGLGVGELLEQGAALCASVVNVDLGSLVAVYDDRAFVFPVWHSPRAEGFARQVSRGLRRDECTQLWDVAGRSLPEGLFVNDYGHAPGAHIGMVQAGVRAQAYVPVGRRGEVRYVMVLSRLHQDLPWRQHQRDLIGSAARMMRDLSLQIHQQEELDAGRVQLELALGSAPIILFGTDAGGVFRTMRGSGIGTQPWMQVLGQGVQEAFAGVPQVVRNVGRAIAGEEFDDVVETGGRTYDVHYMPVRGAYGSSGGMLGLGYDVTGRVHAEREAVRAHRQAEALLQLAQAVQGDVLTTEAAPALDALLRVLTDAPEPWVVLWELHGTTYVPLSQRGAVPPELRALHEMGLPFRLYDRLIGVTNRNAYLSDRDLTAELLAVRVRGLAALPLLVRDGRCEVGLTAYASRPWNPAEREVLETVAGLFGAAVVRLNRVRELEMDRVSEPSLGSWNRRTLNAALEGALRGAADADEELLVVSVDVQGLRGYRSRQSEAGRAALSARAEDELRAALPGGAELFRLGIDEFVAVCRPVRVGAGVPGTPAEWVWRAMLALRAAGFAQAGARVGTARYPVDARSVPELLRVSDERLMDHELHS
ncbi:GAF domain-containing protein [Deinococcus aquiradiocola]|uniref:GAF domain-containing protein n=1 Tax=Deinococcus aquiradiocola TaxID=393059 RepID=A0A917PDB4_9DEIO|nr:GAF domain-containing protein [Deinococcus aquiradiocola]GGJ71562.1 hypothetical protein GCM10008939_14930 [Deinococcus aquiradiocola]